MDGRLHGVLNQGGFDAFCEQRCALFSQSLGGMLPPAAAPAFSHPDDAEWESDREDRA
jgi:hypothetical protein